MWWRENGSWGYQFDGMAEHFVEKTHFGEDDKFGQRDFTQAIATWLDDENQPHRNRLAYAHARFRPNYGGVPLRAHW